MPTTYPPADVDEAQELRILSRRITTALVVVAVVAMVFTAVSVTTFALDHGVNRWVAWTLDPMVAVALLAVLLADARLVELGAAPSGWATALRWFAGMATWVMNAWSSVWPDGGFGVPRDVDAAGVVLHSVAPVLLVLLAEAATGYRRVIAENLPTTVRSSRDLTPRSPLGAVDVDGKGLHSVETAGGEFERVNLTPANDHLDDHRHDHAEASRCREASAVPVVAAWSSSGPADDQRHDHLGDRAHDHPHDQAGGHPVVAEVVAPVVASRPGNDRSDDQPHDHAGDRQAATGAVAEVVADRSWANRREVATVAADGRGAHQVRTPRGSVRQADGTVTETVMVADVRDAADRRREAAEGSGLVRTPAAKGQQIVPTPGAPEGTQIVSTPVGGMVCDGTVPTETTWVRESTRNVGTPGDHFPVREGDDVSTADPMSDVELRRAARRLNREAVRATRRPVTVDALRTELGVSRRRAAELRREVVAAR
ncbi:hypothetical protein LO772_16590 [Yinghuangia sp. ASG 101]|uniref:hypothetical protein n=1 Tax=Yinghuangia sp. ASG 101 TaxID=2896848 RepID=UPI001E36CFE5|nr:hypothetical protein [Yinghuangia sp. ASG 101]UGQ15036.1 hypothetical protein LO772_16590 [Yinghuangia sp. ASG 101]